MQSVQTENIPSVGIYCLANDVALDWLRAAAASVREHAPAIPFAVIPFDDNIARTTEFCRNIGVPVVGDSTLRDLDELGAALCPGDVVAQHMFRKLWAFWGMFDRFLYLDADIVMLQKPDRTMQTFFDSDNEVGFFDICMDDVYLPGEFRDRMINRYGSQGFNAGCYLSRRGLIKLADLRAVSREAVAEVSHFGPTMDQPFFNYYLDVTGVRTVHLPKIVPSLTPSVYANAYTEKAASTIPLPGNAGDEPAMALVHWAGESLRPSMPHFTLFLEYRLRGLSLPARWRFRVGFWFNYHRRRCGRGYARVRKRLLALIGPERG